jgi:hypothetical protein
MQRNKGQQHNQLDDQEAHILPCCVNIVTAPATPMQRQAWTCLWRALLMEDIDEHRRKARGSKGANHDET